MNRQRAAGAILTVGGLFITLASLPHALLGWPALRDDLQQGHASPDAILTATIALIVGASYMLFGVWAMIYVGRWSPHFLAFMVLGAAVAFGAWSFTTRAPRPKGRYDHED